MTLQKLYNSHFMYIFNCPWISFVYSMGPPSLSKFILSLWTEFKSQHPQFLSIYFSLQIILLQLSFSSSHWLLNYNWKLTIKKMENIFQSFSKVDIIHYSSFKTNGYILILYSVYNWYWVNTFGKLSSFTDEKIKSSKWT